MLADERRRLIAERLRDRGSVTVATLASELGISPMTARRDLDELERQGLARRAHGGAVRPGLSGHEDAFAQRLESAAAAKERLAAAAVELVCAGQTIFLDSSTTSHFVARALLPAGIRCTVLTNAVPVMQLLSEADGGHIDLIGLGGSLRRLARSFVGPQTVAAAAAHFADRAFFSVSGVASNGHLTDPDPLEAEVKRTMIRQAAEPVLLVDGSKFRRPALSSIVPVTAVALVIGAGVEPAAWSAVDRAGVAFRNA